MLEGFIHKYERLIFYRDIRDGKGERQPIVLFLVLRLQGILLQATYPAATIDAELRQDFEI